MKCWVVITTINPPKKRLFEFLEYGWKIVVVGDAKTSDFEWEKIANDSVHYLSLASQERHFPELSNLIGPNTYARKNIGYLYAAAQGADAVFDTDDDTFPRNDFGDFAEKSQTFPRVSVDGKGFFNPYVEFAPNSGLWPRGYPLDLISKERWKQNPSLYLSKDEDARKIDIIQTLVNLEPDLDAIYRMTVSDEILDFPTKKKIFELKKSVFSPGNTQSTLWSTRDKFQFLYIPVTVSFRFCDIFKIYIAQRFCSFAYASFWSEQIRNPHTYMKDFESEIECFLKVTSLTDLLSDVDELDLSQAYSYIHRASLCRERDVVISKGFMDEMQSLVK